MASADLPPEAQAYLQLFPEKALTLDLVIGQAVKASDSYRGLRAQRQAADVPTLYGKAPMETRLSARAEVQDDRTQPQTPFQPNRTQAHGYSLGLSSAFTTGTELSFELFHGYRKIDFSPSVAFAIAPFFETRGSIGLKQHLWKDFFGKATRSDYQSALQQTEARKHSYEVSRENWFFQLAEIYYQAWFAQTQERASEKTLERQQRLLRAVEVKLRRGTSEEPDRLQVLLAKTQAEIQLQRDRQNLGDLWRNLITVLKLPAKWAEIDPADIPMKLDNPVPRAMAACEKGPITTSEANASIAEAEAMQRAAGLAVARAQSNLDPSLDLSFGLAANGINAQSGNSLSDFAQVTYPRYSASLVFTLPFGFYAERAALTEAVANELRADAAAIQARDAAGMNWINGCLDLKRLQQANAWLVSTARDQRKRENLEEERFQLGRSGTLQVIQAGGDATQAGIALSLNETALRLSAWKILRLTGKVREYLNQLEQTKAK